VAQQLNLAFFSDKTLLILDDRRVTRTSWQYQSSTWGFKKTIVLSVQKGVDYIRNNPNSVDVIMIDIDKPQAKVNPGIAVLDQIRSIPFDVVDSEGIHAAAPTTDRKPVPCVLVSYHRRNNHAHLPVDGTGPLVPSSSSLSPYQGSSSGSISPVSPFSPTSLASIKDSKPSHLNESFSSSSSGHDAGPSSSSSNSSMAVSEETAFGQSTCTPNTMNSGMLVAKPWTCRNDRSASISSASSNKCASPTTSATQFHLSNPGALDADASVGHLIKPVKQSKLLPMFHGLMTGSWPLASSAAPDNDSRADERKRQLQSLECLLVDDNPVNQKVISRMLGRMGIVPELANNGQEAVELCRARAEAVNKAREEATARGEDAEADPKIKQYDVVFMDIWMPVLSGHQATTEIRVTVPGVTAEEPFIVAMTACVMPGDREKCIASGMNQYLSKPIRKEELCVILERWLDDRAKAEKELKQSNQRKLIQKKKREMLQKRSLALLTSPRAAIETQMEPAIVMDDDEDDDDEDDEDEDADQAASEGLEVEGGVGLGLLDGETNSPMTDAASQRRRKTRPSKDPLMDDADGTLGCRDGGGGGLKMVAVTAEECRVAREKNKARRKDGALYRGGSITLQDPAAGHIPLVDPNLLLMSDDDDDEEEEDSESEDGQHQSSRPMFPEGLQLDRVSSNTTVETVDTFHTMDTTSDSFHTARTHPSSKDSSQRNSFATSDTSSIRTIRAYHH